MKIIYYNHTLKAPIGGGTHAREVLAALNDLPQVVVDAFPALKQTLDGGGTSICGRGKLWWLPKILRDWLRFWLKPLRKEFSLLRGCNPAQYDVILFRPNMWVRMIPSIKARFPGRRLCVEFNSFVHAEGLKGIWPNWFWKKREARLIDSADSIMVVSQYLKKELVEMGVDADKILVNHNGANLDLFQPRSQEEKRNARQKMRIPHDAYVLGYVGGMEPFRRLPFMISQLTECMKIEKNIYLVMAGKGADRPAVENVLYNACSTVKERIRYKGVIPYNEVPTLMSTFDCALFPYSNDYGSPQKIFEYMAMDLPVIGPDVPAVRELFEDGQDLLLAKPTGENFIALVEKMMNCPEKASAIAGRGRDLVRRRYTWQANAARLVDFLRVEEKRLKPK